MEFPENLKSQLDGNLTLDKAIEMLLAAIAHEQFALGNILEAEALKIKHAVSLSEKGLATLDEVKEINNSAFKVIKSIIKKEMLLEFELDDLLDCIPKPSTSSTTSASTTTTTSTGTTTTITISTTTSASTSTTTSRTSTSSTTTKHSRCKWLTLWEILLLVICIANSSNCSNKCCSHTCFEDSHHCRKDDCCCNDYCNDECCNEKYNC
jgi:hypothetical protein